jgi:glycosyltransferase involved in cell wall biosynthesis
MLSIIIPTLNEEKYLPLLLGSIKKQNFKNYEIIVADAGSIDKTVEIAKKNNCKVISGGLPAKGRNEGAKIAKGDILFFIDADAILVNNFSEKSLREFNKRKLDIASFCLYPYPDKKVTWFLLNIFYNKMVFTLEEKLPHSAVGILIKRNLFNKLNGYDEAIKLAEDWDLARRAMKCSKFGIIKSTRILVSDRRLRQDGLFTIATKTFLCDLHNVFIGPVKSDIFNYKFNHYKKLEDK